MFPKGARGYPRLHASHLFAARLRWSRDLDQAECSLQKHFAARAIATSALTSYVSRLEVACARGCLCNAFAVAVGDKPLSLNDGESLEREP